MWSFAIREKSQNLSPFASMPASRKQVGRQVPPTKMGGQKQEDTPSSRYDSLG